MGRLAPRGSWPTRVGLWRGGANDPPKRARTHVLTSCRRAEPRPPAWLVNAHPDPLSLVGQGCENSPGALCEGRADGWRALKPETTTVAATRKASQRHLRRATSAKTRQGWCGARHCSLATCRTTNISSITDGDGPTMTKGRLEAFTDGVVAIIITIMVLEMRVPQGADWAG